MTVWINGLDEEPVEPVRLGLMRATEKKALKPRPFLKWAGGKRELASQIIEKFGPSDGRYFEPFVGAGAILFTNPSKIGNVIGDLNTELITTYRAIRDTPNQVVEALKEMPQAKDDFYRVRALDRDPQFLRDGNHWEIAARMIYLNRLCYNGLYRVNSRNEFNVPFGERRFNVDLEIENLYQVSDFLAGRINGSSSGPIEIREGSFENTVRGADSGDLVYFDPPYAPVSSTASFVGYQPKGFSRSDQETLRDLCVSLSERGVRSFVSNSDSDEIRNLYSDKNKFKIHPLQTKRRIAANADSRQPIGELLVETIIHDKRGFPKC